MPQKATNIQTGEIPSAKLNIKSQPLSFPGNGQSTHRRNPVLFIEVVTIGGLALWSPSAGDRRNEQKATFIQKEQGGAKSCCVFLYVANGSASNEQSLLPSAVKPGVPAFGNSTPSPKAIARHGWDDIERQIPSELPEPPAAGSKDQSDIHTPLAQRAAAWPNLLSVLMRSLSAALERPGGAGHWDPVLGMRGTIARRSFWMPPANGQQPTDLLSPSSIAQWRFVAASPALWGFHGVSCPPL